MPIQRMFTVSSSISDKFVIVWTRSTELARSWAARNWNVDPVFIDVWPTTREDQGITAAAGLKDFYA